MYVILAPNAGDEQVTPHEPDPLPLRTLDAARLLGEVGPARAALARHDGMSAGVVNPRLLLSPLLTREAVLSSKIEGTQTSVDEVLEYEAGIRPPKERYDDLQEVVNYRSALRQAAKAVRTGPIDVPLILSMHGELMSGVRGGKKSPGQFRDEQNWIALQGQGLEAARFVPPAPGRIRDAMRDLVTYADGEDVDVLVQCAVVLAQFEILRPFADGNGRVGRLLVPLFLFQKRAIREPVFYMSEVLEGERERYYDGLRSITAAGDWTGWVAYFLDAVRRQANANVHRVETILDLYVRTKPRIQSLTRSQYAATILDAIFDQPVFTSSQFADKTGIDRRTVNRALGKLTADGLLTVPKGGVGQTPPYYVFSELVDRTEEAAPVPPNPSPPDPPFAGHP